MAACGGHKLALHERTLALEGVQHQSSQGRIAEENFTRSLTQQFGARPAEEPLNWRAHQHYAGVPREEHQAILQLRHKLIHVVFQRGENFPAVSHLPAEIRDLQRDQTEFVMLRFFPRAASLARQAALSKGKIGYARREKKRNEN